MTVTEIAHRCGFGSPQAMRRHFIVRAGTSPRDHRAAFRRSPVPALT